VANDFTAFFERLTAASAEYNQAVVGEVSALNAVYTDMSAEAGRNGQTIRVPFADVGAFTDQGALDWTFEDQVPTSIDLTIAEHPGKAIIVRDFEQTQTSSQLIVQYLDPMRKRAMEYANGRLFAQITTGNFNTYPPLSSAIGTLAIGDARQAWNILVRNKVPIRDTSDSAILYHTDVHANTLTDTTWYQENLVGAVIAKDTRQNIAYGDANVAFRFRRMHDQQAVTGTAAVAGTHAVTAGSASVVGTTTAYGPTTTPVGSWLVFSSQPTQSYQVVAIADATHITISPAYNGTTNGAATATRVTYTGVAMHRFAMALVTRTLPLINNSAVSSTIIDLGGLPVRMQMSYQHPKDGAMLTMDYVMGVKVIRPSFGIVINS
jgi:hypothetical protein